MNITNSTINIDNLNVYNNTMVQMLTVSSPQYTQ